MKQRHVFLTGSEDQADRAVRAAAGAGVANDDIHLVARPDIEINRIHDRRKMADSDFIPAAMRGALTGGGIGLVVALALTAYWGGSPAWPALGLGLGAVAGAWASSLIGATIQDPIRRHFAEQIDRGDILVVLDSEEEGAGAMIAAMVTVGAVRLPYEFPAALT